MKCIDDIKKMLSGLFGHTYYYGCSNCDFNTDLFSEANEHHSKKHQTFHRYFGSYHYQDCLRNSKGEKIYARAISK